MSVHVEVCAHKHHVVQRCVLECCICSERVGACMCFFIPALLGGCTLHLACVFMHVFRLCAHSDPVWLRDPVCGLLPPGSSPGAGQQPV